MTRRTNQTSTLKVSAGGALTLKQARILDMAALEQLPEAIRALLNELNVKLATATVAAYYASICRQAWDRGGSSYDAEVQTCRKLVGMEADDLDRFAAVYRTQCKVAYPHEASNASVLRYGPLAPRRGRNVSARGRFGVYLQRLQVPEVSP